MVIYKVSLSKQAQKKLASLSDKQKILISGALRFLGVDPDDQCLDIVKLAGRNGYRMRVGKWRIIYYRDDYLKIVSIEKIGARGDVYK